MIVYKFPVKNFTASEGYTNIQVIDNKLVLKNKPNEDTLALIEKHNGKEVIEKKPKVIKHKAVKE